MKTRFHQPPNYLMTKAKNNTSTAFFRTFMNKVLKSL